jgi:glycine/D-amino acid oxidase-like deaminating enzyme
MRTESYWTASARGPRFESISNDIEVDAVVIGGGLTGITTAYLLKKEGARVALLERGRCADADTGHTTAHLTYVTDKRLRSLVKDFGRDASKAFWEAGAAAIDQIHNNVRDCQIECEFRWVPGFLHAGLNSKKSDVEALQEDAGLARELGFDAVFLESVPFINRPGVRFAHQAKFHPLKYLGALLERINGEGSYI